MEYLDLTLSFLRTRRPSAFRAFPQQGERNPRGTTPRNAYTLVGGIVSYDTTPWSTVYVRAENVFNPRYEEVYSYRSPGAGVYAGFKVRTN